MTFPAIEVSQTPESKFREYLATRPKPQRFTDQQRDLVKYIFSRHTHFDADQLLEDLKIAQLNISRATVYRTLSKLVDAGLLRRIELNGRMCYEHDYGYPQHDHLVCESCHKMIEFLTPELDEMLRQVSAQHQFQMTGHTLIIRGTCIECNRARGAKRKLDRI